MSENETLKEHVGGGHNLIACVNLTRLRWAMPCPSRSAMVSTLDSTVVLSSWLTLSIGLKLYSLTLISVWEVKL